VKNNLSVSVAMTTFNGDKYVSQQIESIITQLGKDDELIIADDGSTDDTVEIISEYAFSDKRIQVMLNNGLGLAANFEKAIKACGNDLIFLSDQDDVWMPDKVETIKNYFILDKRLTLIMSDGKVVDKNLSIINDSYIEMRGCSTGVIRNIIKNSYLGCAMAYRKSLNKIVLPIPPYIPMNHDCWIGILAKVFGNVKIINEKLILYRRHDDNVTPLNSTSSMVTKLLWRLQLSCFLLIRIIKITVKKDL